MSNKTWDPFFISLNEKNQKDSIDFWHRNIIFKIRIELLLIYKTKKIQRPWNILFMPSWRWGQVYLSLNSAMPSLVSEVEPTLKTICRRYWGNTCSPTTSTTTATIINSWICVFICRWGAWCSQIRGPSDQYFVT